MNKIYQARILATFVHFNQRRSDGEDYINHPKRMIEEYINSLFGHKYELDDVVISWLTKEEIDIICSIWLHDTLEDGESPEFLVGLIYNYFGEHVWELVGILTHDQFDREHAGQIESYNTYIERVSENPEALKIKFIDMIDNTSYKIPEKQFNKYREACIHLGSNGIEIPKILQERLKLCSTA